MKKNWLPVVWSYLKCCVFIIIFLSFFFYSTLAFYFHTSPYGHSQPQLDLQLQCPRCSQLELVSLHFSFLCCFHWMNDEWLTDIILITMLIILKSPSWLWSLWLKHPLPSQPIIFSHVYQTPKQHLGWVWIFKPLVKFSPGTSSVFLRVHLQVGAAPLPGSNDWGRQKH